MKKKKTRELISVMKRAIDEDDGETFNAAYAEVRRRNVTWVKCYRCNRFCDDKDVHFVEECPDMEDELGLMLYDLHPDGLLCQTCVRTIAEEIGL